MLIFRFMPEIQQLVEIMMFTSLIPQCFLCRPNFFHSNPIYSLVSSVFEMNFCSLIDFAINCQSWKIHESTGIKFHFRLFNPLNLKVRSPFSDFIHTHSPSYKIIYCVKQQNLFTPMTKYPSGQDIWMIPRKLFCKFNC